MKKIGLILIAIITFTFCSKDKDNVNIKIYSEEEMEVLKLVNQHRASIGKPELKMDETIYKIAKQHSKNMAEGKVGIGHKDFEKRVAQIKEKYGEGACAENVAAGYPNAEKVVQGWLGSSGHKKNIEGNYTICGIAIVHNAKGVPYYTHLFFNK